MKFALKTALLTTTLSVATLAQANFVEGQDYKALPNPETIAGDVIVVREFFGTVARIAIILSHICKNGQKHALLMWHFFRHLRR